MGREPVAFPSKTIANLQIYVIEIAYLLLDLP